MSTVVLTCATTTITQPRTDPEPGQWLFRMDGITNLLSIEQKEDGPQSTFLNIPPGTYACACGRLDVESSLIGEYAKIELVVKGSDVNVEVADKLTAQVFN